MKTLILEGVRAFRDRAEIPLGKLTLLVGENSTGKSTVLASTRIAWDIVHRPEAPIEFNEDPFELGTYDSIAHYHGGQGRRVKQFTIGGIVEVLVKGGVVGKRKDARSASRLTRLVETTFTSERGNPVPRSWRSKHGPLEARIVRKDGEDVHVHVHIGDRSDEATVQLPLGIPLPQALRFVPQARSRLTNETLGLWEAALTSLPRSMTSIHTRPVAFAPVRSRPRRTYDPIHQRPDAEGQHIPALLARLHRESGAEWKRVSAALEQFGEASGLFQKVLVRSLGKEGDPFQIEVGIPGQKGHRNLLDVGYGVSQVLPVLVEAALARKTATLLLQQPEVHLHPRAQAELGTLLSTLTAGLQGPQCIVETHSDYLVDRVAMAVRDPRHPLSAQDVSLLFFQPDKTGVTIHPLRFDPRGNVVDAPQEYRSFFLHEHARFLGLDDEDGA